MLADCRRRGICLQRPVVVFIVLWTALVVAGCGNVGSSASLGQEKLLSKEGTHRMGPWRYEYSVANKGTRSEGHYGKLFYREQELPAPAHINDYYETPWGRIYWVGHRPVLFGNHGWMASPLAREPIGQALADSGALTEETFVVRLKVLTAEELGAPDLQESEKAVRDALKPFGLQQAHVQRNWFQVGREWITLHDTKRWGSLELRLAEPNQGAALAIALRSSGDLTVDTTGQENPFEALLAAPTPPGTPKILPLPPQAGALRVFKCTLSGIPFDTLELFLLCQIEESNTNDSQH